MSTICFYARYEDSSGDGCNGLTVTWDIERITRSTGARSAFVTGGATTTAVGRRGLYVYTLTNADLTLYDYVATAITASATPTVHEVAALWTLWSLSWYDILTSVLTTVGSIGKLLVEKLGLITSGSITVTEPVVEGGNVVTYRGDSYLNADDRALEWESASWPDLTTATIAVIIDKVVQFAGTVVTPTGTAVVRLELTSAQSATIPAKRHNFQVVATIGGENYTLVAAAWVSRARAEV
jgi:hypothetical protein